MSSLIEAFTDRGWARSGCAVLGLALASCTALAAAVQPLRVCADANDLPFSNTREEGFENALAGVLARDLHRTVEYVWISQQAPYARKKLGPQACDVSMATTASSKLMVSSIPYYRSSYVFVTRRDRHIRIASLDDRSLAKYKIGAQIIGEDDAASPPAEELARRGMAGNLVGYSVYGMPLGRNTSEDMVSAVAEGSLDMAIVWGPAAGYFVKTSPVPLDITPILPSPGSVGLPVAFDISLGVRRDDQALRDQLNEIIARRQDEISELLRSYGVPLVSGGSEAQPARH